MVTGDTGFLSSQLQGLIDMYNQWNVTKDKSTGLYHRTPLLDAQEFSLPGFLVGGPNGGPVEHWNSMSNDYNLIDNGPEVYRISFNSYMLAAARSISSIASMAGQGLVAQEWNTTAMTLLNSMRNTLYDEHLSFWIDVIQGSNIPALGRQEIGYYPYRFGIGTDDSNIRGLEAGLDNEHFIAPFGPTTLERTNPYYSTFKNITYCCIWNGQSWPFSTSIYLHTLSSLARNNLSSLVTPQFFRAAFSTYTRTNYKDGEPYTAEVHYPTVDSWSGDTANHSENYFHSTYMDNIFTDLFGIIPTFQPKLQMQPLVALEWDHWAIENLPYHGTLLSILYDEKGMYYSSQPHDAGLSIYSAGELIHHSPNLPTNLSIPLDTHFRQNRTRYINILANPNAPHSLPTAQSSYYLTPNGDSADPYQAWKTVDGLLWYDLRPDNFWTANQSATPFTTLALTLPRPRTFRSISLALLGDLDQGGLLDCPESVRITNNRTGTVLATRVPWESCKTNALNTVVFEAGEVTTDAVALDFVIKTSRTYAISEVQIWVPEETGPRYEAEDALAGTFIGGFDGRFAGGNTSLVTPSGLEGEAATDGGLVLGSEGWIEWGGVIAPENATGDITVVGAGEGSIIVGLNFLRNVTVEFGGGSEVPVRATANDTENRNVLAIGDVNKSRDNVSAGGFEFLTGGNVVTIFQAAGMPFVDAIVLG